MRIGGGKRVHKKANQRAKLEGEILLLRRAQQIAGVQVQAMALVLDDYARSSNWAQKKSGMFSSDTAPMWLGEGDGPTQAHKVLVDLFGEQIFDRLRGLREQIVEMKRKKDEQAKTQEKAKDTGPIPATDELKIHDCSTCGKPHKPGECTCDCCRI